MSDEGIDTFVAKTMANVKKHGWAVTGIFGDHETAPFAYTTGLAPAGHELVITGLSQQVAGHLLNDAARLFLTKTVPFEPGARLDKLVADYQLAVIDAATHNPSYPMSLSNIIYPGCTARQLVWPDKEGRFPWEPNCTISLAAQPLLGLPPEEDPFPAHTGDPS